MKSLKPCPFCGGEAEIRTFPGFSIYRVACKNTKKCECGVMPQTLFYDTEDKAIAAWNRRKEQESEREV